MQGELNILNSGGTEDRQRMRPPEDTTQLRQRVQRLEKQVKELAARMTALEGE